MSHKILMCLGMTACVGLKPIPLQSVRSASLELVLLFDRARFGREDQALDDLWAKLALSGSPERGLAATQRVLQVLAQRVQGDAIAQALVKADLALVDPQVGLLEPTQALRGIWREGADLAPSAALRLHAVCLEALRSATQANGTAQKIERVDRCLYAVRDADPSAYFAATPQDRPADPSWRDLVEQAQALFNRVPPNHPLRTISSRRAEELSVLVVRTKDKLPAAISPWLSWPRVTGGLPYDRYPLLQVAIDGLTIDGLVLDVNAERTVAAILAEDRRQRLAIAALAALPWSYVVDALRVARRAGVVVADLAVKDPENRIASFPVSIARLWPGLGPDVPPRDLPRGAVVDPREEIPWHLVVMESQTVLHSQNTPLVGEPVQLLAEKKARAVLVSASPNVSYGSVMAAIASVSAKVPAIGLEAATLSTP